LELNKLTVLNKIVFAAWMLQMCLINCGKSYSQSTIKSELGYYLLHQPKSFYQNTLNYAHVFYADCSLNKIHLYPRYNFDLLNTGSINWGYNLINYQQGTFLLTPYQGFTWGNHSGLSTGLQLNYNRSYLTASAINQFLWNDHRTNNWYSWSEVNWIIKKKYFIGCSAFIRQFIKPHQVFIDMGPQLAIHQNKFRFSAYFMNIWASNRYFFIGISFTTEKKHETK
jgi:hypothetical protein